MTAKSDTKTAQKPTKTPDSIASEPCDYLSLKTAQAHKSGQRATGAMHYRILSDPLKKWLYLMIVGNDGAGYYSKEAVAFSAIEHCLNGLSAKASFPSKLFQPAFSGKSINNAGFLAAILRAEGLLQPVPDKVHLHQRSGDWDAWKASMLTLPGEPFTPPAKEPRQSNNRPPVTDTPTTAKPDINPPTTQPENSMSTNQEDDPGNVDGDDPVTFLTGRKPRRLPGDKQHPSADDEADHVDPA